QMELLFVDRGEPVHHAGIGTRLCAFGNDIGIEQEAHSEVSRMPPSSRSTSRPEPRSGEARMKSAKLPIISRRCVFSQSSASTTTTALLPLRVIACGPLRRALSITSLNLALAWATVHVSEGTSAFITTTPSVMVILVIIVIASSGAIVSARGIASG